MDKIRKINFKYTYVDMGSIAGADQGTLKLHKDRIFLDVGNDLRVGVIDHHHKINGISVGNQIFRSATKLVTIYPDYILQNLNVDATLVDIVIHKSPDFDCFAAAYLTEYLITYGEFPEGYEIFADYVDKVDAGFIRLQKDNYKELYAVAYSIEKVLRLEYEQKLREPNQKQTITKSSNFNLNEEIKKRWFTLIDYVFQWINNHKGFSIYGTDIFDSNETFRNEINYVKEDYELYRKELKDPNTHEKVLIKLPKIQDDSEELDQVEGLLFKKVPQSTLTKAWARVDADNSSGDGFVFTMIPTLYNSPLGLKKDINATDETILMNKVIISVEPNSGYHLKGLAKRLEEAEVEKEELIFDLKLQSMRCRDQRRPGFDDEWCCNDDPWYDGRNFNYTIVDAPRRGSLLSIEEMKEIVLDFTVAYAKYYHNYIVLPFTIEDKFRKKIYADPSVLFEDHIVRSENRKDQDYFLDYLDRYLYSHNEKNHPISCKRYSFTEKEYILIRNNSNQIELKNKSKLVAKDYSEAYAISSLELILYKYGVGFILINSNALTDRKISFREVLHNNQLIRKSYKEICHSLLNDPTEQIKLGKPMLYSTIVIHTEEFYTQEKKEMIYKLCNCLNWDDVYANSQYIETSLDQLFMEMDDNCSYGFSKSGGALLCTPQRQIHKEADLHIKHQIDYFQTIYLEIFLYSLHQRLSLMRFANNLSQIDGKYRIGNLRELRSQLMNFVTQGWFSQITENEIGQEIYRRWQAVFECETLYQEVLQQIETVDEYKSALKSKSYENYSILVFPMLLVLQIVSSDLIKTKTLGPDEGFDWWYTLGSILILSIVLLIHFNKKDK